jgi:hypothetical protein
VYAGGSAASPDFPKTTGAAQQANAFGGDGFVARLNSGLTQLVQATYLGGSAAEGLTALAIHPATGEVYAGGTTNSSNFPGTLGGAQSVLAGGFDGFVARLNRGLTRVLESTYLGGTHIDGVFAVAVHPASGDAYAAGTTFSVDFPGTMGGAQPSNGGARDAFVARLRLTADLAPAPIPTLSEWVQVMLLGLIVAIGIRALRRRPEPV